MKYNTEILKVLKTTRQHLSVKLDTDISTLMQLVEMPESPENAHCIKLAVLKGISESMQSSAIRVVDILNNLIIDTSKTN
ncbi:MAG: hypothetical protein HOK35_02365 [Cytophagia bacterium]|jgi:hypothetical protein|nr:hypothetical protein [Cytophagia bacterium]